jgi:hypothetical protein
MRRPKKPADKSPSECNPPGGRAWLRVQQFARARGLDVESLPGAAGSAAKKKKAKARPSRQRKHRG